MTIPVPSGNSQLCQRATTISGGGEYATVRKTRKVLNMTHSARTAPMTDSGSTLGLYLQQW
jgi:hypothetical protein